MLDGGVQLLGAKWEKAAILEIFWAKPATYGRFCPKCF